MRRTASLPDDFPVGTRYVVEGKTNAKGALRVSARFVVFPDGRRIDLPLEMVVAPPLSPRTPAVHPRRSRKPVGAKPAARPGRVRVRANA